jgi:hypothetical protein
LEEISNEKVMRVVAGKGVGGGMDAGIEVAEEGTVGADVDGSLSWLLANELTNGDVEG